MGDVNLFIQIFVFAAFAVFMAFALATVVLMIHLTSLPERGRRAAQQREQAGRPSGSFAD